MEILTEVNPTSVAIPSGWERIELSEFAERSPRKFYPNTAAEQAVCVELEHVAQVTGQLIGTTHTTPQSSTKNAFSAGEVIFGKLRPYLRKYLRPDFDGVCSSEFWVLRGKPKKCLNEFLFYLVQSESFVQACAKTTGSKMPRADWDLVQEQPFLLPPKPEQQRIATILDACDRAIDGTAQLLEKQEKRFDILLHGLLGDEAGTLLERATSWPMTPLGELGEIVSGGTPDSANRAFWDGDVAWCTPTDITALKGDKYLSGTARSITPQGLANSSAKLLPINSVLVCTRATVGECVINTIPVATNQGFKNIIPHSIQAEFLYYALMARKQKLISLGSGSTFLEVSKKDFVKLEIPTPDDATQTAVSRVLAAADGEIAISKLLIQQHQQQKKGLMQRLLTGQAFTH